LRAWLWFKAHLSDSTHRSFYGVQKDSYLCRENGGKSIPMKKKKAQTQPDAVDSQVNDVKALRAEVARLQAQLKHEKLRADAYDERINVAESMFKIPIRKKAGAKR
jgi:hypothetical protein